MPGSSSLTFSVSSNHSPIMTEDTLSTVELREVDYLFRLNRFHPPDKADFEQKYNTLWQDKSDRGVFRYKFDRSQVPTKTIGSNEQTGVINYVVQLNLDRSLNKRDAHKIDDIRQPFDDNRFNFTKIAEREFMFKVKLSDDALNYVDSHVAINVSPLELGHTLILPDLKAKLPQILTKKSLLLAVNMMLCIHSPDFRVGYNGLLAYASVNHLHLHCYYLNYNMALETIPVEHLAGDCYTLTSCPAKGFVFQIRNTLEIQGVVRSVLTLTNFLLDQSMAHNLYITRGLSFDEADHNKLLNNEDSGERDCLRVYVWTRKPSAGIKSRMGLHPALCELFGHFLIKDESTFEQANDSWISHVLSDLTDDCFDKVRDLVRGLF